MIYIGNITIPQLTGEETRRAYVYLPASYYEKGNEDKRYPVLYMFDGHNIFYECHATYGKSWGMRQYVEFEKPEIIIVAVECNHSPDHGRLKEYSPYTFLDAKCGKVEGKGKIYMDWLIHEFKPFIDTHFRTLPDRHHTMIAGSSMGGLMSFYAVTAHNDIFSRAACLSPSLYFSKGELARLVDRTHFHPDTFVYMDYGQEELGNHKNMLKIFNKFSTALMLKKVCITSRIIPGGNHSESSWEKQIPFFMDALLYHI